MEVQALTRNARMSPKKVREVARTIQGRMANDAVEYLTLIPRKSARLIVKTLKSAIANAENNANLKVDGLVVKEAVVGEGPTIKRMKTRARGSGAQILKRTSHIRIVLTDEKPEKAEQKMEEKPASAAEKKAKKPKKTAKTAAKK